MTAQATVDTASTTSLRALLLNARWALRLILSTNASVTAGLVAVTVLRGLVPAALALFARGVINAFVEVSRSGTSDLGPLVPWLLFGLGLTLVEAVSPLINRFLTQRLQDDLNLRITSDILVHAAKLDVAFFEDPRTQEMIERAQQNTAEHVARFVSDAQLAAVSFLQTVSLVGILMTIEPLVLLVLGPFTVPYLIFQWRLGRKRWSQEYVRAPKRRWTRYFVSRLTGQPAVAEVKLLELAPFLIDKFRTLMTQFRDQDRKLYVRSFAGGSVFAVLTTVLFFVLFVRVIFHALDGGLTVGDIAIFGGATSRLRSTLDNAISSLSSAMERTLYISNLMAYLSVRPGIVATSARAPSSNRGDLEFEDVSFTYPGSAEPALRGISFHVQPGESVALVGENGAGKTTLVKLIARLYDPDQGSIRFEGIDLRQLSLEYLHGQISCVLQGFGRYEATAADNIAYGDWRRMLENREKVEQIARLAGVHGLIEAMPQGYDTMLGRMFGTHDLSGGQWQRIAVARAFARQATLLILDEPTSNLDARAEYELFCRFRELSEGRTTILISHRFSTLSMADRLLVMDRGRIVESGTHQELVARAGHYAALYDLHRRQMGSALGT
jgi:ATP-binding cassette subfamily B protein